jgi:hypothetical protein
MSMFSHWNEGICYCGHSTTPHPTHHNKHKEAVSEVDAIIKDLKGRSGLRHAWENIDADIRAEIRQTWIEIVESRK